MAAARPRTAPPTVPRRPAPPAARQVSGRLEEVLSRKDAAIRALQLDVAKVSKAHNDLIRV
jgi:hypothetical protein